jgi:predicted regulator of Ras-like GTPase activity (Roadblock/LC7/MglB family)
MKLFTLMKGIFGKTAHAPEPELEYSADAPPGDVVPEYSGYAGEVEPASEQVQEVFAAPAAEPEPEYASAAVSSAVEGSHAEMVLPLAALVASLPVELQQRVRTNAIAQAVCAFPMDKILPQLSQGLVRVTFGDIRQSAPQAFSGGADRDFVMISLPLNELVSRLSPTMFGQAPRRQVEVPDDITSPFGPRGQGLALGKRASETSLTSRPRGAQSTAPVPPAADPRARGNVVSVPPPTAPASAPPLGHVPLETPFQKPPITPIARPAAGNNGGTTFRAPGGNHGGANGGTTFHTPAGTNGGTNGGGNNGGTTFHTPGRTNGGANGGTAFHTPAPLPQQPAVPKSESATISVELAALGESLPEPLRLEVAHLNLDQATIALPIDQVEPGIRSGKLVFAWKKLRAWMKPAPPAGVSAHDNLAVTVPLAVVAPLFLGHLKAIGNGNKRIVVDEKIPNLFFGFPQPEAAPTLAPVPAPASAPAPAPQPPAPALPVPTPSETNYFVYDDAKEEAQLVSGAMAVHAQRAPTPGTTFASRKSTPNEVVTKASLLEGVYGALVALPDGLLVAGKLDTAANGDTIAALIPQMYSKLSGCTKELRMGELNNLNFTVGNVPWKIFRVNGLFFAAFGSAGERLPTAQLADLAAALDYRKAQ